MTSARERPGQAHRISFHHEATTEEMARRVAAAGGTVTAVIDLYGIMLVTSATEDALLGLPHVLSVERQLAKPYW